MSRGTTVTELERFKEAIKPYLDGWKSIDIRCVSCLILNKWINLATRITLSELPASAGVISDGISDIKYLKTLHDIRSINDIDKILSNIEDGMLTINSHQIFLGKFDGAEIKNNFSPSYHIQRKHSHWLNPQPGTSYLISLYQTWDSIFNLLHHSTDTIGDENLDWKLRSLDTPYDGLGPAHNQHEHLRSIWGYSVVPIAMKLGGLQVHL